MKKGFTLIELLVVVLIVGILSAIALPQYQKAVEKARSAEALINLRALVNAMQLYKLANGGEVARSLDVLDLQLTGTPSGATAIGTDNFVYDIRNFNGLGEGFEAVATRNGGSSDLMQYYIYYGYNGGMSCVAKKPDAKVICSAMCLSSSFSDHSTPTWKACAIN